MDPDWVGCRNPIKNGGIFQQSLYVSLPEGYMKSSTFLSNDFSYDLGSFWSFSKTVNNLTRKFRSEAIFHDKTMGGRVFHRYPFFASLPPLGPWPWIDWVPPPLDKRQTFPMVQGGKEEVGPMAQKTRGGNRKQRNEQWKWTLVGLGLFLGMMNYSQWYFEIIS